MSPSVWTRDRAIYLDLWHGECREARAATEEDLEKAPYVVSADPYTWKLIFERKLEPIFDPDARQAEAGERGYVHPVPAM